MAAEGSEFEGVLRYGNREALADGDDSERSYVFVEQRESDESSLEDLHVVEEGADPSGDENDGGHVNPCVVEESPGGELSGGDGVDVVFDRERSVICESYMEVPGGGGGGGGGATEDRMVAGMKEEGVSQEMVGNRKLHGSCGDVLNEQIDSCLRLEGSSARREEPVFLSGAGIVEVVGSPREPSGDHGKVDEQMGAAGVDEVREQSNDELVVNEVPITASQLVTHDNRMLTTSHGSCITPKEMDDSVMRSSDLAVCSSEEKMVDEEVGVGQAKWELRMEKAESRELQPDNAQKGEEQRDSSSLTEVLQEEAPEKLEAGIVECEELISELGARFVEVAGSQKEPTESGSLPEGNDGNMEGVEAPRDDKVEAVPEVPIVVPQDEIGDTDKQSSNLESGYSKEESIQEDEEAVPVETNKILCPESAESEQVCLDDGAMAEGRTDSSSTHALEQEASRRPEDVSISHEHKKSEPSTGAVELLASQEAPTLKNEHEEEDVNIEDAGAAKIKEKKNVESTTELPIKPTDQEHHGTAEHPIAQPLPSKQEKLVAEGVVQVKTNVELLESQEFPTSNEQVPREQPDTVLSLGTLPAKDTQEKADEFFKHEKSESEVREGVVEVSELNPGTFRKADDNILASSTDKVEETKDAELVADEPINVPLEECDAAAKLSSNLKSCLLEEEISAGEVTVPTKTERKSCPEVLEDENSDKVGQVAREQAGSIRSFQPLQDDSMKELAGSSGEYEESPSEPCHGVSEYSEFNQETLNRTSLMDEGNVEGDDMEAIGDNEVQEQKNNQPDAKVPTKPSEGNLDSNGEQSFSFESLPTEGKEMYTHVNESSIDSEMRMDKDVGGDREVKVDDRRVEHSKALPIPHVISDSAVDGEVGTQSSSQSPRFPWKKETDTNDGSCPDNCRELGKEASCLVDPLEPEIASSERSVDNVCNVTSHATKHLAPEVKVSHAFIEEHGTPSSTVLNIDSPTPEDMETGSGMNVTDSSESSAAFAISNVESAKSMLSSFVEDQEPGPCHFKSEEVDDRQDNLAGDEQDKPGVVEDGMYFTPREDTRSLGNDANWEPAGNSNELEGVTHSETTFPVPKDCSIQGYKDATLSMETSKEVGSKEDGAIEDVNDNGVTHSMQEVTDSPGKDSRFYIVRLRRNQDDILASKIELAQLEVEEKTQRRDSIRKMIQKQKAICDELWKNVEDVRKDERAARQAVAAKFQKIRSIREKADMIELVNSIDDTDDKMNSLKHRMQHETIPLKEEKQLLQKMKELMQKREDLSSKLASQSEMEKVFEQKGQIQDQLKHLMPELDSLKKALSQMEVHAKAAKKKYDDQCAILRNLQEQHRAADDLRQAAYKHLRSLRKELNEKNVHFYKYKDDARAAAAIASSGDKEALWRHCCYQIERFMELWNKNNEFRSQYVQTNQLSIIRRFGTLDGRSLGPDEEPAVVPYSPDKGSGAGSFPPLRSNSTKPVERKQDIKDEVLVSGVADKPLITVEKAVKQDKQKKTPKTNLENVTTLVLTEESKREEEERDRAKAKEESSKSMADELARKEDEEEQEARREQVAAELKEKIRLEQIAKAREAEERKRRKAEKAKAIAEIRARREAEQREKKRQKKERLKEKKAIAVADAGIGTNEAEESAPSPPQAVEILEAKVSPALPVPAKQQQQHGKVKPLPPPLRNRGKKKMQMWMWVLLCAVLICILLLLGNHASLGVLDSRGF